MQLTLSSRLFRTVATVAVLGASTAVHALTLGSTGTTVGASQLQLNNFSGGTSYSSQWLGAQQLTSDGGSPFWAYCIDPKTSASFPSSVYTSSSLSGFLADSAGYQGQFTASGYSGLSGYGYQSNTSVVQSRLEALFSYGFADSLTSAVKAAAFGYAVWEIIGSPTASNLSRTSGSGLYGKSDGSTNGGLIQTRVDQLLNAVNGTASWASIGLSTATNYIYTVYYDPVPHTRQNFLTVSLAPPSTVPVPGTLALIGVAVLGLWGVQRRRQG